MNIETRSKKHERTDEDGLVIAMRAERPLVKIETGQPISNAKAVCVNGQWFIEALGLLPERLESEWTNAR